jgi:hypothetical protein
MVLRMEWEIDFMLSILAVDHWGRKGVGRRGARCFALVNKLIRVVKLREIESHFERSQAT